MNGFHFSPPLPLARELKVGPARGKDRSGLRTSPVSWLGGSSVPVSTGPVPGLPAALPLISDCDLFGETANSELNAAVA